MNTLKILPNKSDLRSIEFDLEFDRWICDDYTRPLKSLGFEPEGMLSTRTDMYCGCHVLIYREIKEVPRREDWLKTITDRDEEGHSSRGMLYCGTLIITIAFSK